MTQPPVISDMLSFIRNKRRRHILIDGIRLPKETAKEILNEIYETLDVGKDYASLSITTMHRRQLSENHLFVTLDDEGEIIIKEIKNPKTIKIPVFSKTEKADQNMETMYDTFVKFEDIIYITSSGEKNIVKIVSQKGTFEKRISLSKLIEELPDNFIQIEKRDVINMEFLQGTNPTHVFLKNGQTLSRIRIGKKYKENLDQKLNNGFFI